MRLATAEPIATSGQGSMACFCCPPSSGRNLLAAALRRSSTKRAAAAKARNKPSAARANPRRIDVHHHIAPPIYVKTMTPERLYNGSPGSYRATYEWTPAMALEDMDKGGTATAITSIYSGSSLAGHPAARRVARECNDYATQLAHDHPGRFGVFAALPLPDVEGSLLEIEYALDALKADGFLMMTSYANKWLGDPAFAPVFEELNRRNAVVYTHPHEPDCCRKLIPDVPGSVIEFATDTTRTIASLLFSGTASRCPKVRFIFSHAGGTLPFLAERFTRLAQRKDLAARLPKGVLHEIKKFYYEVAQAAHPFALSPLTHLVPISQILFGTDFPYRSAKEIGQGLVKYGFSGRALQAINRDNALALFPRMKDEP